ncbi:hypothetical protein ACKFKF_27975 [Phormidesmis sp. 146-12]
MTIHPLSSPLPAPLQNLYDFMSQHAIEGRVSLTIREMVHGLGLRSPAPLLSRLQKLIELKLVSQA